MAEGTIAEANSCTKGRHLGFLESLDQLFISKNSSSIYWHAAVISTTQPLKESSVLTAFKILVRKQEALQMRIVPENGSEENPTEFLFKPMDDPEKIEFESVEFKTKHDWPMFISKDHDSRKIDCSNGPLWRAILGKVELADTREEMLYEYIILLKFHHAIADGKSVFDLLYRQFLPILSALVNNGDAESIIPFVPQMKSVEELFLSVGTLKNPIPWYIKLAMDIIRWKNRTFKQSEETLFMFPDDPIPCETDLAKEPTCVPTVFDKDVSGNAIAAAKSHGITVHCLLLSAGAIALCRTAKAARTQLPSTFKQMWPVDLRKFLNYTTPQPLGDIRYSAMTNHKNITECTHEEFWSSCKTLHSTVKHESGKDKCTQFLGMSKYLIDASKSTDIFTVMSEEMPFNCCISLSNLGNTSSGTEPEMTDGPVQIRLTEHFLSLSGIGGLQFVPMIEFVVTFEGKFMLNIIYDRKKVSRMFVQTYLENLEEVLKTYCLPE